MVAAAAQISSTLCCYSCSHDISALNSAKNVSSARFTGKFGTAFATRSTLAIQKPLNQGIYKSKSVSIRCEQSSKEGNGLDVWLGRLAMVGFASAISVEIATGKGLLENFGIPTPLPTVALAVTLLVGALTAVFIFQSASEN